MTICVNCVSVSAPVAAEKDTEDVVLIRPQPKVKRRWQWSKGAGPGEYGGPITFDTEDDYKPPKIWGKPIKHPLENKSEFIWNINWKPFFDEDENADEEAPQSKAPESSSGFLSFSRVMEIDRVDVDLSKELLKPVEKTQIEPVDDTKLTRRWNYVPTRRERLYWERSKKATESMQQQQSSSKDTPKSRSISRREEKEKYKQLATRLQILTLAIGGAGTACAFVFYSPEASLSYGVGLAGSFAYIRMLGNSVDGLGRGDAKGAVKGALGQPRLLVPLILTMLLNRWNELLVPGYGVASLQMIPMLVGFFTYKLATIVQVVQDVVPQVTYENDK